MEPQSQSFDYRSPALTVMFGSGRSNEIAAAVDALDGRRALVLSTAGHRAVAEGIAAKLENSSVGVLASARIHTPVEVTEQAVSFAAARDVDCLVSVGGGSAIGLGKAIAIRTDLPQVAIPTTYAGSEMTDILGETREGVKTTQRTEKVRPEIVIYDVDLTLTLPARLSATSGMNAIAHAVEALYARDCNPVVSLMAEEGIRALAASLPAIAESPTDVSARGGAQYGAWLCGLCLGTVSMALHHKLCHVLGGMFDLPHSETHAILLPHAVAFNTPSAQEAMIKAARALGVAEAARGLFELSARLGAPTALKTIGMPEDGIDAAVEAAIAQPYWNPRPLEVEALRKLVTDAYFGRPPAR